MQIDFDPEEPIHVTILTSGIVGACEARVLAYSGKLMTIRCESGGFDLSSLSGSALKIESPRYIVMGETVETRPEEDTVVLRVRHALSMDEVTHLQRRWI